MNGKDIILYGAGQNGSQVMQLCRERVLCYCDSYNFGIKKDGLDVISMEELRKFEHFEDYNIVVTVIDVNVCEEIIRELAAYGLHAVSYKEFRFFDFDTNLLHVYGNINDIKYEHNYGNPAFYRIESGTIPMLNEMFEVYVDDFGDHVIDFYLYFLDDVFEAEKLRKRLQKKYILSYSTIYAMSDTVVPVPDYKFWCGIGRYAGEYNLEESLKLCEESGKNRPLYNKAFWAGNISMEKMRIALCRFAERYPEVIETNRLEIDSLTKKLTGQYIEMRYFPQYKYLIDIRGAGWTDRVKFLLAMRRPLLLVDRPFREYYFDRLEPMKHFVPIKEDLSDLLEKIEYLDKNPEVYKYIVENASEFVHSNFKRELILKELRDAVLKYGLYEEDDVK